VGLIDEILQIVRSATTNNIKELRIKKLVSDQWKIDVLAPLETVKHICERLHISQSKFRRRWKRRPPGSGRSEVGPSGRLIHVQCDSETDRHLKGTALLGDITPEQIVAVTIRIATGKTKKIKRAAASKVIEKLLPVGMHLRKLRNATHAQGVGKAS
jgi:hypothetical protein